MRLIIFILFLSAQLSAQFIPFDCIQADEGGTWFVDGVGLNWDVQVEWIEIDCDTQEWVYIVGDTCCSDTSYHEFIFEGCCEVSLTSINPVIDSLLCFDDINGNSSWRVYLNEFITLDGCECCSDFALDFQAIDVDVYYDGVRQFSETGAVSFACGTGQVQNIQIFDVCPRTFVEGGILTIELDTYQVETTCDFVDPMFSLPLVTDDYVLSAPDFDCLCCCDDPPGIYFADEPAFIPLSSGCADYQVDGCACSGASSYTLPLIDICGDVTATTNLVYSSSSSVGTTSLTAIISGTDIIIEETCGTTSDFGMNCSGVVDLGGASIWEVTVEGCLGSTTVTILYQGC